MPSLTYLFTDRILNTVDMTSISKNDLLVEGNNKEMYCCHKY